MDFVNKLFLKYRLLTLLIFVIYGYGFSQEDEVKISLRDYHSASITASVASKKYPYFFTADQSGKVLVYSTETKRVVKTIRSASGIPIKSLRLSNDDRVLTINQKYNFSDGKLDSIISISVFDQKILMQNAANLEFVGNQEDAIIIRDTNADKSLNIIDVYNKNFEKIHRFYASYNVNKAAYNMEMGEVALVQSHSLKQHSILVLNKMDYEEKQTIIIPSTHQIHQLFYDSGQLFALATNLNLKTLEIFNLSKSQDFKQSVYQVSNEFSSNSLKVNYSKFNETIQLSIHDAYGYRNKPLIIQKTENEYRIAQPRTLEGVSNSVFLYDTNEYLYFEPFNPNFSSYLKFLVYSNALDKITDVVPKESKSFYQGTFLPDDSWLVVGRELKKGNLGLVQNQNQLKYYQSGTFFNRFGKLDYANYMEVNHGVKVFSSKPFTLNKRTSSYPFYGSKESGNNQINYGFYAYNLIKDNVSLISLTETNKRNIVDYNATNNVLLLSQRQYYDDGLTEPQNFSILKNDNIIDINGSYKYGKVSKDGKFLLLISGLNEVSIHLMTNLKIIYKENIPEGYYKVFTDENSGFVVTAYNMTKAADKCNTMSKSFTVNSGNNVSTKVSDCVNIIDYDAVGDTVVVSMEFLGLLIGEKTYKFPQTEFPVKVSFNSDASKLMVNFNNGKIKIYKTKGLELLAEMVHPDKSSHVFVDANSNYFTNVKPDDYVLASLNGKSTPIQNFEEQYFNPEAVLKAFGNPNKEYVEVLNKALALKQNSSYNKTDIDFKNAASSTGEQGDLYLLSVGVSDYKETDFNLTYADKDALDIAKIYGNLDKDDNETYYNKFFGTQYSLTNETNTEELQLRRYEGLYKSTGNLYALNKARTLWLEHNYGKFNLWNYDTGVIKPIKMPEGFKLDAYTFEEFVFINPNDDGFYIISQEDVFYKYSFLNASFTKVKLPFALDENFIPRNAIRPIRNNEWIYFSQKSENFKNQIVLSVGVVNDNAAKKEIKINPSFYEYVNDSGIIQRDSLDVYSTSLKAISPNGHHLVYNGYDNDLFYVNLSEEELIPKKLNIKDYHKFDEVFISNDGRKISTLKKQSNNFKYQVATYTISGERISQSDYDVATVGISGYNCDWSMITSADAMVKEDLFKNDSLLASSKPKSFKNLHVKYLTNSGATSQEIKNALKTLVKNVKPNDQVVLFLAGHGVLDKDLNYYFAPHDMLFNNVKKNGVSFNDIIEHLKLANTTNKLLLMDSCHSGNTLDIDSNTVVTTTQSNSANERGSKSRSSNSQSKFKVSDVISDLFEDFLSNSGVTVISASSGEDVAYENKAIGNGAFTSAYIKTLKSKLTLGGFTLTKEKLNNSVPLTDDAITILLKEVMLLTNGKQTPDLRELNKAAQLKMW